MHQVGKLQGQAGEALHVAVGGLAAQEAPLAGDHDAELVAVGGHQQYRAAERVQGFGPQQVGFLRQQNLGSGDRLAAGFDPHLGHALQGIEGPGQGLHPLQEQVAGDRHRRRGRRRGRRTGGDEKEEENGKRRREVNSLPLKIFSPQRHREH